MKAFQYTKMRARPSTSCSHNSHLLAVARVASNRGINASMIEGYDTFNQGKVAFYNLVLLHLLDQCSLATCIFRHNNQPRGIFIEAMDNSWT